MKNEQTAVIKDMEFLLNELHKEWERPGEVKSSVSIPYEKVEEISRKLNVIVYETQQSADSDGLAFKQSIAKSKQSYDNQRYGLQDNFMIKYPKLIKTATEKLQKYKKERNSV